MFPVHKNSYLQTQTSIDPRIINRCVDKARENPSLDQFDALPPFLRVTSNQPCIPTRLCDVTRRPLAFGKWALPKLRRELHSEDPCVVVQAINTISDLVHDPERNYEAIKLKIPARLVDLLRHEDLAVRERTLIALSIMGDLLDGKYAIVNNQMMLKNLTICLHDANASIRLQTLTLLERLSLVWMASDYLVDHGFIEILIDTLGRTHQVEMKDSVVLTMKTLQNLMYCNGKYIALENGLFDLCLVLINTQLDPDVIGSSLKTLSILMQTDKGKQIAFDKKILKKVLYKMLYDERQVVYENALSALLFATIKVEALVKAYKLKGLIPRLIQLAKGHLQPTTQKLSFQILANLAGHGKNKKYLLETKFEVLNSIHIEDPAGQRVKDILLFDTLKFS